MGKRKNNTSTATGGGPTIGYESQLWQMADALLGKHMAVSGVYVKLCL